MSDVSSELIDKVFRHIQCPRDGGADIKAIEALREAFSRAVPFENLTVLNGEPVSLRPDDVLSKLASGRGGYCFELNTAFHYLLKDRGLSPSLHLGRVWLGNPAAVPPRSHLANVVKIEGQNYIIDVGFGGRAPKAIMPLYDFGKVIDEGEVGDQPLRVIEDANYGVMVQRQISDIWMNKFSLELEPAHASDINVGNFYQSHAPGSRFRNHLLVGRFTSAGRLALFDNRLTIEESGKVETRMLQSLDELISVLTQVFELDPSGKEDALEKMLARAMQGEP